MWASGAEQLQVGVALILMAVALTILLMSLRQQFLFFHSLKLPAGLCTLLGLCLVLYLSSFVAGALGLLQIGFEYGLFFLLNGLVIYLLPRYTQKSSSAPAKQWVFSCDSVELLLCGLGIVLCAPLLHHAKEIPWQMTNPNGILGWDVVSYHLPGVIEFIQAHSLWSMQGPYQSYGYAFELIATFFSKPFYAHWGLALGHWLGLILIILAIHSIARTLGNRLTSNSSFSSIPISLLTVGLFSTMVMRSLGEIGKNDLFMGAMVLSTLALLVSALPSAIHSTRCKTAWTMASLSAGLALATKPSALGYALFIPVAIGFLSWQRSHHWRSTLGWGVFSTILIYVIGGFWLTRNFLIFDTLSPVLEGGWRFSVFANLANSDLYRPRYQTLYVLLSLMALPVAYAFARLNRLAQATPNPWWLLLAFHTCALITLLVTPFMFQRGGWELRLAIPLIVSTALIWSVLIYQGSAYINKVASVLSARFIRYLGGILIIGAISIIAVLWQVQRTAPLAGYNQLGLLPKTDIYQWVWEHDAPLRIYAAGLRPYGLYGKHWQHRLFYDLHSAELGDEESVKARLASIVLTFNPDVILIASDPHQATHNATKPGITSWMDSQATIFEPIYSDRVVSGYRLRQGGEELLRPWLGAEKLPKMGG